MGRHLSIIILFWALFVLPGTRANAQIPSYVPAVGLVAWYPFSGNAGDSSGNGINGTVSGATLVADRFGSPNSAYSFNGTSDYIELPYTSLFDNSTYSISLWVKTSLATSSSGGPGVNQGIISRTATGGPSLSPGASNPWAIFEDAGSVSLATAGCGGASCSGYATGQTYSDISDNTWHHIVFTTSATLCICYLDGVKTDSNYYSTGIAYLPYVTRIGLSLNTYWRAFLGSVDDIAIYNRVLSPCEVSELYNASIITAPIVSTISGTASICESGGTIILSDVTSGGTWTSSAPGTATAGSLTGIITGVSAGTATISYTTTNSCGSASATVVVTVNPLPSLITGTAVVCAGSTTALSNDIAGGTWSSSLTTIATVGSTGVVTGVTQGTTTITYTLPTGCETTTTVTVNPQPTSITGPTSICLGAAPILGATPWTGTWSSSNTAVASVGSNTGIVSTISAGTTVISYTLPGGCFSIVTETVNPLPSAITGTMTVCAGSSTPLTDVSAGGTWSSSSTTTATVGSTGVVSGAIAGTTTITYTLPTGCETTSTFTVYQQPTSITGSTNICMGASPILGATPWTGTWTSSNVAVATIGSNTGIVSTVGTGTAIISYTLPGGCFSTLGETVNPLPASITGIAKVCAGFTTALTDASTGGTWSSGSPTFATVGSTGIVSGISPGTAPITYSLPTGCITIAVVSVNLQPAAIGGSPSLCLGTTTILSATPYTGTWSSSNTSVATVGSVTGIVTAGITGTSVITYLLPNGCLSTITETVNPLPSAITGTASVCAGSTTPLTDASAGGTWTSGLIAVATVGSTGLVSGMITGTANITYTIPTGCIASITVTVNRQPNPISGGSSSCLGSTIFMSDIPASGTWSSSNPTVASIGTSGVLTTATTGTTIITYTLPTSCFSTLTETVNPVPAPITGTTSVCTGLTTALTNTTTGGTWSSSSPLIATIGSTGIVSGISTGTAMVSYTLGTGCAAATIVTVNLQPGTISGASSLCVAATTFLGDIPYTGSWSSGTPAVASIGAFTGLLSATSAGTTVITYALPDGCYSTLVETINPTPAAIAGTASVCAGFTTTLSDGTTGGTWSSVLASIATIGSTGVISGVSAGTTTISYILTTGCSAVTTVTVNLQPGIISGPPSVCVTGSTIFGDVPYTGSWSSGTPSVASVGEFTGILSPTSAGTTIITYTLPDGCFSTFLETINPVPASITGIANVCTGLTTMLTDGTTGGTWSSVLTSIASIGTSGIVSGVTAGTTEISYTLATGCTTTTIVTVNLQPGNILGATNLCTGIVISLSDSPYGGSWSSGSASASIGSSSGSVTPISTGTAAITYTLPSGCFSTITETINPQPAPISGTGTVCTGFTTALSDGSTGGTWNSGSIAIATIGSTGLVTGIATGTTTISYTLPTGCTALTVVTVNLQPSTILGATNLCAAATAILSDITPGGTWSISTAGAATIGTFTGIIDGVSAGTAIVTYILPAGCFSIQIETVNPVPAPIMGTDHLCAGASTTLSDTTVGGSWSSASGIATVGSSGMLIAVAAGTTTISYTLPTGCSAEMTFTVNFQPGAILGTAALCSGSTTILSDVSTTGTWSSGSPGVATVGTFTGIVSGISAGTAEITYLVPSGCYSILTETINSIPAAITGIAIACAGAESILSDITAGGTWSCGADTVATVNATGSVTAIAGGNATITYTLPDGCSTTIIETVNPLPAPITGTHHFCVGVTTILGDISHDGIWSSSDTSIVTVGAETGIATGRSNGSAVISYTLPTGCSTTITMTDSCASGINTVTDQNNEISIFPNPNKGTFSIKGSLGSSYNGAVFIDVKEMTGRVVYSDKLMVQNGKIDQEVLLENTLANGMYLLTLHTGNQNTVFHFVIMK